VIRHVVYGILMWVVCLYAFSKGGWAERLAAAGILVATYLTVLVLSPTAIRFHHLEFPVVIVDSGLLALLLFIALRTEKFWPLWLAAMQALTIFSHLAPFVPHMLPWAYHRAVAVWIYPMLIILGYATRLHHLQQRDGNSSKG